MKPKDSKQSGRPTVYIKLRRTVGFSLGVLFLALVDLRYHFLPGVMGRRRDRNKNSGARSQESGESGKL